MPNKIKIAKYVGDTQALGRPASQRSAAKPTGLYLLALRSRVAEVQAQSPVPRPRLKRTIPVESTGTGEGTPEPVKITLS